MDGLDQTSTAGAPAALPRVGRTIRHHPHACGVRATTSWGASLRWQDAAAELLSVAKNTGWDVYCVLRLSPVCSRAV